MAGKKATRAQLEKRAAELGATIDWGFAGFNVDTPRGKVWRANGCSTIAVYFRNSAGQSWKPEAYADALEDMEQGLDDATSDEGTWWEGEE